MRAERASEGLVDVHAHLTDSAYGDDLDEIMARAHRSGVRAVICTGYDLESSRRCVELAASRPDILAAVGIHPNYAAQAGPGDLLEIEHLAELPRVVAVGETGLDNYRTFSPPETQEAFFLTHLAIARRVDLPVVVHNREASARVMQFLSVWADKASGARVVLHCFSGDLAMLRNCIQAGFFISLAGPVTFRNSGELSEVVRQASANRLLLETDSPYLTPAPYRGRRNEPANLRLVAEAVAKIRGEQYAALAARTTANAIRLFPAVAERVEAEA